VAVANFRFLYAYLYLEILSKQKTSLSKVYTTLNKLPVDQEGLYESLMDRVLDSNQGKEIALIALRWVTFSKEPLSITALLHALAIELGLEGTEIREADLVDYEDLLSSCAGFLVVDKESEIVHLVHYTAYEYLKTRKEFMEKEANTFIAKACLTYFNLNFFSNPELSEFYFEFSFGQDYPKTPLFMSKYALCGYTSTYWGDHAREGNEEDLKELIMNTLFNEQRLCNLSIMKHYHNSSCYMCPEPSILHLVSACGLSKICSALLNSDRGYTTLSNLNCISF
jgi:hypothetical protein